MSTFRCKLHSATYLYSVLENKFTVLFSHEPEHGHLLRFRATIFANGVSIPVYQEFVEQEPSIDAGASLLARYSALPNGVEKTTPLFPEA